jgi:uncharacterized membrane protein
MNRIDRLLAALLWFLGVLAIAGFTHIVAVFALPEIAAKDTFARISELAKPGELTILPPSRPDKQVMPFADPAMVQSVCPFDLSQGGLRCTRMSKAASFSHFRFALPPDRPLFDDGPCGAKARSTSSS